MEQLGEQHLHVKTLPSGERVLVDPAVTSERIYNWFYFFINVGALAGQISMVWVEKYVGFYLSYVLPTAMLCLCPAVMIWGRKRYSRREPGGSVLGPAMKTFFLAQKGRWSINPFRTWKNMHDGTFWDNVKPSRFTDETRPAWMNFDDAWVDELRRGFAACAVFCWYPLFWLCYNQSEFHHKPLFPDLVKSKPQQSTNASQQPTTTSSPRPPSCSDTACPTMSSPT